MAITAHINGTIQSGIEGPSDLNAADAAWITRCLNSNGFQAKVIGLNVRPVGTGQMAHCVRFELAYADENARAPATLIGKFSSPNERSKTSGNEAGYYRREVSFYNTFARSALLSIPTCFHASHDPVRGEFALILEDLAPAEQGDQLLGVTIDRAHKVVQEAAKLHATHWGDTTIDSLSWVYGTKAAAQPEKFLIAVREMWVGFKERYAERIEPEARTIGDRFFNVLETYDKSYAGPRCLIHNDFRPDNMMFATAKGGRPVTVLDWQTLAYGHGASDVCYFLAGALPPTLRREHERGLMDIYYDTLLTLNVSGYSREQLDHDYRWHAFQLFVAAVVGAMVVQQAERGDAMFLVMLHGATDQIMQWDSLKLLEACA